MEGVTAQWPNFRPAEFIEVKGGKRKLQAGLSIICREIPPAGEKGYDRGIYTGNSN